MKKNRKTVFLLAVVSIVLGCVKSSDTTQSEPISDNTTQRKITAVEQRVDSIIKQLTLEEKIDMLSGNRIDEIKGAPRIGLPAMRPSDGPLGLRIYGNATAFPSAIAMAASWDDQGVGTIAAAMAREFKAYDKNVLLGPCVNIIRSPHGGRNFESFGEDPFLTSRLAVSYINAVQNEDVIACVKHFACNNQEIERKTINVKVDDRALHEIYFPAFKASILDAKSWSIMGSYNRLNGHYACANKELLTGILKDDWEFPGFVMSDWNAIHSTVSTLNAGTDIEMPLGKYLGKRDVYEALTKGEVSESRITDAVRRIVRAMVSMGIYDRPHPIGGELNSKNHRDLAREAGAKAMVLLKNEKNSLPIKKGNIKSIALIGPGGKVARASGGGSSKVIPFYTVSPLDGLKNKYGTGMEINYALGFADEMDIIPIDSTFLSPPDGLWKKTGLYAEYFDNGDLEGVPLKRQIDKNIDFEWQFPSPASGRQRELFSIRWEGFVKPKEAGKYILSIKCNRNMQVFIKDQLVLSSKDGQNKVISKIIDFDKNERKAIKVEYKGVASNAILGFRPYEEDMLQNAVEVAKNSDMAVIIAGWSEDLESEGVDRSSLSLPENQIKVIQAISQVNKNVVVVLHGGAQIVMDRWIENVQGIIMAWYPGQECGNSLADILSGDTDPSGKLPLTFMKKWEDHSAYENYPGTNGEVDYKEGIYVGYRHFDKNKIEPLFPFGYGLSYTTFSISDIKLSEGQINKDQELKVTCTLKNTGDRKGAEVVQLYITDEVSSLDRPIKELKGFKRIVLDPAASSKVEFTLNKDAFSYYDHQKKDWVAEAGKFKILLGNSSRDLPLSAEFELE